MIEPTGVVSTVRASVLGCEVGAGASLAGSRLDCLGAVIDGLSDFCMLGWRSTPSSTKAIVSNATSATPSRIGRRRATRKAFACSMPPAERPELCEDLPPSLPILFAVSASAACAARRAAAIWALIELLGGSLAIASAGEARSGAPDPGSIRNSDPSIERMGVAAGANCGARKSGSTSPCGGGALRTGGAKTGALRIVASIELSAAAAGAGSFGA